MAVTQSNGLNRSEMDAANDRSPTDSDEIRRDIDRTRSVMDSTIDELGQRLQPRSLFDDLVASLKGSLFSDRPLRGDGRSTGSRELAGQAAETAGTVGRSVLEAVRENPIPAALMGAGLAWLLFEDKAERAYRQHRLSSNTGDWRELEPHSGSYVDARTGKPYDESYGDAYKDLDHDGNPDVEPKNLMDKASRAAASVKQAVQGAAGAIGGAAGAVGSAAGTSVHAVKQSAHAVGDMARKSGHAASSTKHALGDYRKNVGESMRHARDSARDYRHDAAASFERFGHVAADKTRAGYAMSRDRFNTALDEQPLAVGVAAMAVGLLAGFALPRTRAEDRTIGRGADDFRDEAMRRGREVVDQGREVAAQLADEALGDAERQGLTPDAIGSKVGRVAKEALHAAKDAARREGIDAGTLADKAKHVGESVKEKGKTEIEQAAGKSFPAKVEAMPASTPGTSSVGTSGTFDSTR